MLAMRVKLLFSPYRVMFTRKTSGIALKKRTAICLD